MRLFIATCITLVYSLTGSTASASTFTFDTDPFAGILALVTPGRKMKAAKTSSFSTLPPTFLPLDATVFDVGNSVSFANDFLLGSLV